MAETVTIQGQSYLKRNPLGVLGLTIITLGIYGLYWYYKANAEILRSTGDQTISPSRSLLAVIPGFLLIVPPFIAYYNTSNHIVQMQEQRGIQSQVSPALVVILALVIWFGMAAYVQEHLNRVWDSASAGGAQSPECAAPEHTLHIYGWPRTGRTGWVERVLRRSVSTGASASTAVRRVARP